MLICVSGGDEVMSDRWSHDNHEWGWWGGLSVRVMNVTWWVRLAS